MGEAVLAQAGSVVGSGFSGEQGLADLVGTFGLLQPTEGGEHLKNGEHSEANRISFMAQITRGYDDKSVGNWRGHALRVRVRELKMTIVWRGSFTKKKKKKKKKKIRLWLVRIKQTKVLQQQM